MEFEQLLNCLNLAQIRANQKDIKGKHQTFIINFGHDDKSYECECYFLSVSSGSGDKAKDHVYYQIDTAMLKYAKASSVPFLLIYNLNNSEDLYAINLKNWDCKIQEDQSKQKVNIPLSNKLEINKESIISFL